jgi:hypothetical protein
VTAGNKQVRMGKLLSFLGGLNVAGFKKVPVLYRYWGGIVQLGSQQMQADNAEIRLQTQDFKTADRNQFRLS